MVQGIHQDNDSQGGIQKWKTDTCLLYKLNELGTVIVMLCVEDTLSIGDKPSFMDTI